MFRYENGSEFDAVVNKNNATTNISQSARDGERERENKIQFLFWTEPIFFSLLPYMFNFPIIWLRVSNTLYKILPMLTDCSAVQKHGIERESARVMRKNEKSVWKVKNPWSYFENLAQ